MQFWDPERIYVLLDDRTVSILNFTGRGSYDKHTQFISTRLISAVQKKRNDF